MSEGITTDAADKNARLKTALANLKSDPICSLKYLYDALPSDISALEEYNDSGQATADLIDTLHLPPVQVAKPDENEETSTEDPGSYTESILIVTLVESAKWKQLFVSNGAIPKLLRCLFSDDSKEGLRRTRSVSILYALKDEPGLITELQQLSKNESPFVTIRSLRALIDGEMLAIAVKAGAIERFGDAFQLLEQGQPEDIVNITNSVQSIFNGVPEEMDDETTDEDDETAYTRRLKSLYEADIMAPRNIPPIVASWLSSADVEASGSLAELLSKIADRLVDGESQVVDQVSQHLQGVNRRSDNILPITIALFTLLSHGSISSSIKEKLLASNPSIVELLVDVLDPACGPTSQEPYTMEHAATHALASCIALGDEVAPLVHSSMNKSNRLKSILDTLVLIAEFNPLENQLTHINDSQSPIPIFYQAIVDTWSDIQDYVYDEYFSQQFDPQLNPNPTYGAGIQLHVICMVDSRDKLIEAGIVYYLFRIAKNTIVGEDIWESAVNGAAYIADEDNAVDLFGDSKLEALGTADMLKTALMDPPSDPVMAHRAQKEAANIITKILKHVSEDSEAHREFYQRGFLDALVAVLRPGSKASLASRANAVEALAALLEHEPTREEAIKHEDIIRVLVEVALGWNKEDRQKADDADSFDKYQSGIDAANVALGQLNRVSSASSVLSRIIQETLSNITDVSERVRLFPLLKRALGEGSTSYTPHSAWVGGGVIPLLFGIMQEELTEQVGVVEKLDAAEILAEDVASKPEHDYAYQLMLDTNPGIIAIFVGLLKNYNEEKDRSRDILARAIGLIGLAGVAQWSMQDGTQLDTRSKILSYQEGVVLKLVAEILRMDAGTSKKRSHYNIVERKTMMERTKRAAIRLMDVLTKDEESLPHVRRIMVDGGIVELLTEIESQNLVRKEAKELLRRLNSDEMAPDEEGDGDDDADDNDSDEGFDLKQFRSLCRTLMDSSKSTEARLDVIRDLADLATYGQIEAEFASRPNLIELLVETFLGIGDLQLEVVEDESEDEDELRDDDPRVGAAALLEAILVGCDSDSKLWDHTATPMKKVFQKSNPFSERYALIQSIRLSLKQSTITALHRAMMNNGLVDLAMGLLTDNQLELEQLRLVVSAVGEIVSSHWYDYASKQFLDFGALEDIGKMLLDNDVRSVDDDSPEKRMRRLLAFDLLHSLGASELENRLKILHHEGIVDSAVREVQRLSGPLDLPSEDTDDWSKSNTIAMYHLSPFNLLDQLSCRKATFRQAKELYIKANLEQALNDVLKSNRAEDGWMVIQSMNQTSEYLLERMTKDDLEESDGEPEIGEDPETKMKRLIQELTSTIVEEPPYTSLHRSAYDLETMARLDDKVAKDIIKAITEPEVLQPLVDNLLCIGDFIPPDSATAYENTGASLLLQFITEDPKPVLQVLRKLDSGSTAEPLEQAIDRGFIKLVSSALKEQGNPIEVKALAIDALVSLAGNENGQKELKELADIVIPPCVELLFPLTEEDQSALQSAFQLQDRPKPTEGARDLLFHFQDHPLLVTSIGKKLSTESFKDQVELLSDMDELVRPGIFARSRWDIGPSMVKGGLVPFLLRVLSTPDEAALSALDNYERRVLSVKSMALGCLVILTHNTPQVSPELKIVLEEAGTAQVMEKLIGQESTPSDLKELAEEVQARLKPDAKKVDGYALAIRK
ncbi:hypothetical protein FRC03_008457 [Tulasnella sp. 419]|nr:hypothetical protein FRC03_008457 [Tulasnella sp. 419]